MKKESHVCHEHVVHDAVGCLPSLRPHGVNSLQLWAKRLCGLQTCHLYIFTYIYV